MKYKRKHPKKGASKSTKLFFLLALLVLGFAFVDPGKLGYVLMVSLIIIVAKVDNYFVAKHEKTTETSKTPHPQFENPNLSDFYAFNRNQSQPFARGDFQSFDDWYRQANTHREEYKEEEPFAPFTPKWYATFGRWTAGGERD
ncbi:hypothetical protein [Desulfobulbus sp.]|uniref:hypothetical protein n=1 Tax=Desulfobulbus sp. TaxID=895 RepID=UPI00286F4E9B|nr:hypothetical protein [Desulfobulbus sp.]